MGILAARIEALRHARQWSEAELARRLAQINPTWIQTRLNKLMNRKQKFTVQDLDDLAEVFGVTVPELFFDTFGQWDRRTGMDRRKGERRQAQRPIFDPKLEPTRNLSRIGFEPE